MKIKSRLEILDDNDRPLIELGISHGRPYLSLRDGHKLLAWVTVDADGNLDVRKFSRGKETEIET